MVTKQVPMLRVGGAVNFNLKLTDSVEVDWRTVEDISVTLLSEEQVAIAGEATFQISADDHLVLLCSYPASEPQYLGLNRVVLSCTMNGAAKTYDAPLVCFVESSDQQGELPVEVINVDLEAGNISSDLIAAILADCRQAAREARNQTAISQAQVVEMKGVVEESRKSVESANKAVAAANDAVDAANAATGTANAAANKADTAASGAGAAAETARRSAGLADDSATAANQAASDAADSAGLANTATEAANQAASVANAAAGNAASAEQAVEDAEKNRVAAENGRATSEKQRGTNEAARQSAEETRKNEFATIIQKLSAYDDNVASLAIDLATILATIDHAGHHHALDYDTEGNFKVCGHPTKVYGHGAPSAETIPDQDGIPAFIGQEYIDLDASSNGKYYAVGTTSVSNWRK